MRLVTGLEEYSVLDTLVQATLLGLHREVIGDVQQTDILVVQTPLEPNLGVVCHASHG